MCAIVDAGVADDVFGESRTPAGVGFFKWLDNGDGRLLSGGKLHEELRRTGGFDPWAREARLAGKLTVLNADAVDERIAQIKARHDALRSNDHHVIAVAQLGRARLLCTGDGPLTKDFKKKVLIDNPGGKVFKTRRKVFKHGRWHEEPADFTKAHQQLLRAHSCRT